MILLIDNYDSFSYNLYQLIASEGEDIKIIRNDQMTISEIENLHPKAIVISPGPGKPSEAGICIEVVKHFKDKLPILGVCLGHQAICEAFGATISHAEELMHGKASLIQIDPNSRLFKNMTSPLKAGRYHSLAALKETMPEALKVVAWADNKEIMAVEHKEYAVFGLQFHPESILTPNGKEIIANFMKLLR